MSKAKKIYTYRAGKKVMLNKSADEMVIRELPGQVPGEGVLGSEQVSSASTRVKTSKTKLDAMMMRSREAAPTHHAYYEAETGTEFLITDRIFVTFKTALPDAEVDAFAGRYALIKRETFSDRDYLFQLTDHTGMNPVKLVVKLTEDEPLVAAAEHDLNQRAAKAQFAVPTDPAYAQQWHLHKSLNAPDMDTRSSSECEDAWRLLDHFGRQEVVIGVTDDGCKLDHLDFNSQGKFADWGYLRGTRLITSANIDASPSEMYKTGANHGTSCAGVIGGEVDAVLTAGAAPDCRLLPIQWESSGPSLFISDSKLLTVLNYVADKIDVLSNSWGGVPISNWSQLVVNRITSLAQNGGRRGKGILFLWAAGNENCLINYRASVDVPYTDGVEVQGGSLVWVGVRTTRVFENNLAHIPGLMHVAALASTAMRSHYSNYGPGISLCAPSSNAHSYYRMTVQGRGITTTTGSSGGVTNSFGGTSSATPLAAGVAALIISANPGLSALEVAAIMKQTASKDLDFTPYPKTPPASFDQDTRWDVSPIAPFNTGDFKDVGLPEGTWSPWFGHGRVDAEAAVAEALSRLTQPEPGGLSFTGSAAPDKLIPDNQATGVKNTIVCDKTFSVSGIKIEVDIPHTYVGDLVVTLIAPSGRSAVLHNRAGGGRDNLRQVFTATTTAALLPFVGESVNGGWTLHVQDLAAVDRGRLKSWSLELSGQAMKVVNIEESPGILIPDNTQGGIERSLNIKESSSLQDIEIALDITHTYIGDLIVELTSPQNTRIVLHSRMGGSADNIIKTYAIANTPALEALRGESIKGEWKLKVSDHARIDQGKLNRWALKITRAA